MSTNCHPNYVYDNLAFSSANKSDSSHRQLIIAKFRSPFVFHAKGLTGSDNVQLNVEWFVDDRLNDSTDDTAWPILCYVHGICESAETWTVQHLAMACQKHHWKLCVLELEGHGLSTSLCSNFDRLVRQVEAFVYHVLSNNSETRKVPFALCGNSLGGTLVAYASQSISKQIDKVSLFDGFLGAILICPAVGISSNSIPPPYLVMGLRLLSWFLPSAGILTPYEDPNHYACPPSSTRNFEGHWPLATSKMLLDLISQKIQDDQKRTPKDNAMLTLENVPSVLILAGERDPIIPMESVRVFVEKLYLEDKTLSVIPEGDHGFMSHHEKSRDGIKIIFDWLTKRLGQQKR
jgi:alpha-beta hydrolase superfamily lysophospholipase